MNRRPELAVVIPALNEQENLELLLPALNAELDKLKVPAEVVVVDGGSSDGTREIASHHGARAIGQTEPGYGGALLAGFRETSAPYVVTMDADLSHRPIFIEDLWRLRDEGELLIASRYIKGGRAEMSLLRSVLSRLMNRVYARVLSVPVRDLSSGFRMYRRSALYIDKIVARDFDVLEEILIRILNDGFDVKEVPFKYMPRGSGETHARLLRLARSFLRTLFRMWRTRNSVSAADYDYRAFDSPIWLQRYWQRTRHRIVLDFLDDYDSVLDIGCGSSRIIVDLPEAIGLDILHAKLRWLRPHHQLLIRGSLMRLPFEDNSFRNVICSQVIEHVDDEPEVLGEMERALAPGGALILGTPDYGRFVWRALEWVYGKILPDAYAKEHITHFTRKALWKRLESRGFEVEACKYVGFGEMIFKARKKGG